MDGCLTAYLSHSDAVEIELVFVAFGFPAIRVIPAPSYTTVSF